ncbi:MAG: hypothetical protein JNL70_21780 [Saprospiraceae bacterium]|nr:hypothetical protein [Saprospiraceae bacterium]
MENLKLDFTNPVHKDLAQRLFDTVATLFHDECAETITEHFNRLSIEALEQIDDDGEPKYNYFEAINSIRTTMQVTQSITAIERTFLCLKRHAKKQSLCLSHLNKDEN